MKDLFRFLDYLKKHKLRIVLGLLFVILANLTAAIIPRIVGNLIDSILAGDFSQTFVAIRIAEIIGLTALSGLFMFMTRQTIIIASRLAEYEIRRDFLLAIQNQPMNFFAENPTGALMANVTNDISAAREFLGPALMYSANTIATFVFVLYFMLNINTSVTFIAISPLPLIAISTYYIGQRVYSAFKNVQEQFAQLTAQAQESISGIRVIKTYVKEDYEAHRFEASSEDYLKKNMKLSKLQAVSMPLITTLVGISIILILFIGGGKVIENEITLGQLTQFFIYLSMLIWPVAAIGWITNLVQRATASSTRLGLILDKLPENLDTSVTNFNIKDFNGKIEFKEVFFHYPSNDKIILNGLNLSIKAGTTIGIVGPVGCGKSTIVSLVARLYRPTNGIVLIDDIPIEEIPIEVLRNKIAICQQDVFLFSDTIVNNIRIGKPDATIDEIIEICKIAEIDEEIRNFPNQYDTIIGERGVTLSGGQKQRISIARALIKKPKIIIFDDTFSAVDIETEQKIYHNLSNIKPNPTIIHITHRLHSIKSADKIFYIDNGQVNEVGNHNELMELKKEYYKMYKKQLLKEAIEDMK